AAAPLPRLAPRSIAPLPVARGARVRALPARGTRMSLRAKLTLMFFGALQVTFLTAVGAFWAVQSWQLLTDDLTLIHAQNVRLERVLDDPRADGAVGGLHNHAQSLAEAELIDTLDVARNDPGRVAEAAQRLKGYYRGEVKRLR